MWAEIIFYNFFSFQSVKSFQYKRFIQTACFLNLFIFIKHHNRNHRAMSTPRPKFHASSSNINNINFRRFQWVTNIPLLSGFMIWKTLYLDGFDSLELEDVVWSVEDNVEAGRKCLNNSRVLSLSTWQICYEYDKRKWESRKSISQTLGKKLTTFYNDSFSLKSQYRKLKQFAVRKLLFKNVIPELNERTDDVKVFVDFLPDHLNQHIK